jgi:hypothetical protein
MVCHRGLGEGAVSGGDGNGEAAYVPAEFPQDRYRLKQRDHGPVLAGDFQDDGLRPLELGDHFPHKSA